MHTVCPLCRTPRDWKEEPSGSFSGTHNCACVQGDAVIGIPEGTESLYWMDPTGRGALKDEYRLKFLNEVRVTRALSKEYGVDLFYKGPDYNEEIMGRGFFTLNVWREIPDYPYPKCRAEELVEVARGRTIKECAEDFVRQMQREAA